LERFRTESLLLSDKTEGEQVEEDNESDDHLKVAANNIFFKKFLAIKRYLENNEKKFIDLERKHIRAIEQVYNLLNSDQKKRLVPNRITKTNTKTKTTDADAEIINLEQNESIQKIEEFLDYFHSIEWPQSQSESSSESNVSDQSSSTTTVTSKYSQEPLTYVQMMAMCEREKSLRIEMESVLDKEAKSSNKQVTLNKINQLLLKINTFPLLD
jgi:hypothetical protein